MAEWINSLVQSARVLVDDLQRYRPEPTPVENRTWASLLLPVVRPMAVTALALYPGTREVRLAIWAGCIAILAWGLMFDTLPEIVIWPTIFGALGPGTIWAWASQPPTFHPLPEEPRFASLRDNPVFKAIDLGFNYRLINIRAPVLPPTRSHAMSLLYHAVPAIFSAILSDILCYHFLKTLLGFPAGTGYYAVKESLATQYNVPQIAVDAAFSVMLGVETYLGLQGVWHLLALFGVLSGFWTDSEWPDLTNMPWMATSVSDFWGKRYHQLLRETLLCWTTPLRAISPRILHIPIVFAFSAIIHSLTYSAIMHTFVAQEFFRMFLVAALACSLERLFYNLTGRRVGGPLGWIWTWSWMLLAILPQMVRIWWDTGAEKYFRERWEAQVRGSIVPLLMALLKGPGGPK